MASTNATKNVLETLSNQAQLWAPLPFPWGVAYSGGRDSTVLLWCLKSLVGGDNLVALHVDHGWRSVEERAAESRLVSTNCASWGVALERFDPPVSVEPRELAAREHRYRCFEAFLSNHPQSSVWLAHHADDQAETVLMRLLKGRSWSGLAGIPARRGPYCRPLLSLPASLLSEVARTQHLDWHADTSNRDLSHLRNYVRNKVFPSIQERFPQAVSALNDLAHQWGSVFPDAKLSQDWVQDAQRFVVPCAVWDRWSSWTRQQQLKAAVTLIQGPARPPSSKLFEAAAQLGRSGACQGKNWRWSTDGKTVLWERVVQKKAKEYFIHVTGKGPFELPSYRWRWSTESTTSEAEISVPGIDGAREWVWRSWSPGLRLVSNVGLEWSKHKRRRVLGVLAPDRSATLWQDGQLRAVIDVWERRLVWVEESTQKLNIEQIFVTLEQRSDYER